MSRCKSTHYDVESLELAEKDPGLRNTFWLVQSWTGDRKNHDKVVAELKEGGVPEQNVEVVYGYHHGKEQNGKEVTKGIGHLSFSFRWLPRAATILQSRRSIACFVYVESNASVQAPVKDIVESIRKAKQPVVWVGWKRQWAWGVIEGSKAIAFKRSGLVMAQEAANRGKFARGYFWLDGVLSRRLPKGRIHRTPKSFFGSRTHVSVSEGTVMRRPAFSPGARGSK